MDTKSNGQKPGRESTKQYPEPVRPIQNKAKNPRFSARLGLALLFGRAEGLTKMPRLVF
jgi:hypothetical protein